MVTPHGSDAGPETGLGAMTARPEGGWRDLPFLGGDVSLDFVNTAGGRTKARDHDRLLSLTDAIAWAQAVDLVRAGEHDLLLDRAGSEPAKAERALRALREKRESLHAFLLAGVRASPVPPAVRVDVEAWLRTAYQRASLSEHFPHGEAWVVHIDDVGLDLLSWRLALAAGRLLGSDSRSHVSECGRCSWLFLDFSPSRRRRWCSMAICGNRAKAERHHRRSVRADDEAAEVEA